MAALYILYSKTLDRYYFGCTDGTIEGRMRKHLTHHKGFTAKAKDWEVKYSEVLNDFNTALLREKQIKSWKSRSKIEELIESQPLL
jgi:putative endonuclease